MTVLLYGAYIISCKRMISQFFNMQYITRLYNVSLPDAYVKLKIITCAKILLKITNQMSRKMSSYI